MTPEPGWTDRLKAEVPLDQRARFLTELQALVASVRENRAPTVTPLLVAHAHLALAYMDDGEKKERAQAALSR